MPDLLHRYQQHLTETGAALYLDWIKTRLEKGIMDAWTVEIAHYDNGQSFMEVRITMDDPLVPDWWRP